MKSPLGVAISFAGAMLVSGSFYKFKGLEIYGSWTPACFCRFLLARPELCLKPLWDSRHICRFAVVLAMLYLPSRLFYLELR